MACKCQGHLALNKAALREALGSSAIVEALESVAVGRPTVNAAQMWRYFTTSVYASGDLPAIATREALQNSLDAIRAAVRAKQIGPKDGRFNVVWNPDSRSLTWADNGIGMDASTILQKFLSLGDSGKGEAADSSEAAGGFGIAKAVILGVSATFKWELHTRDNLAISTAANSDVTIFATEPRQGTRITVSDVPAKFDERYSYVSENQESILDRLKVVLAANDLPELEITLNGRPVEPYFSRRGGSQVAEGGRWGEGTTARVKAFRRPPGDRGGAFYLRLGGLFQFVRPSDSKLPADIVVDLTTTKRPGESGYPLNAARDQLQSDAHFAFLDLIRTVERENASVGQERDYEVFLPNEEGSDSIAESTREALTDPDLRASMREAARGLSAYYQQLRKDAPTVVAAASDAPAGSRSEAIQQPLIGPASILTTERLGGESSLRSAVGLVKDLIGQGGGAIDAMKAAALDRVAAGQIRAEDAPLVAEAIESAFAKAVDNSTRPGAGGLLEAVVNEQRLAPLAQVVPLRTRPNNPFGALAGLRVSKKNFDRARAYRFRREYGRWLPYLIAWDATLRLVAADARIRIRFTPGFILDDNVRGMAAIESTPKGGRAVIYIHPFTFRSVVKAHERRPLSVAFWLHALACHELTHLDGKMGDGHGESFVSAREELGYATSHLLTPLAELLGKLLGIGSKRTRARPAQGDARRLVESSIAELEKQLLREPPAGVNKQHLRSMLARFRPTLIDSLHRLVKNRTGEP